MPIVSINIARIGTWIKKNHKTQEPTRSLVGHMWFSLLKSDGSSAVSYGFAPDADEKSFDWKKPVTIPGKVYNDDDDNYTYYLCCTFDISDDQYDAMKEFAENPEDSGFTQYNLFSKNCIHFTWKAMAVAGLNPTDVNDGLFPGWNEGRVKEAQEAYEYQNNVLKAFEQTHDHNQP